MVLLLMPWLTHLRALLSAVDEPLNRLTPIPHARPDFQIFRWLAEESASPDRSDRDLQQFGYFLLGQKGFKWVVRVCHAVLSQWHDDHCYSRNAMSRNAGIKKEKMRYCGICGRNVQDVFGQITEGSLSRTARIFLSWGGLHRASFLFHQVTMVLSFQFASAAWATISCVILMP